MEILIIEATTLMFKFKIRANDFIINKVNLFGTWASPGFDGRLFSF